MMIRSLRPRRSRAHASFSSRLGINVGVRATPRYRGDRVYTGPAHRRITGDAMGSAAIWLIIAGTNRAPTSPSPIFGRHRPPDIRAALADLPGSRSRSALVNLR